MKFIYKITEKGKKDEEGIVAVSSDYLTIKGKMITQLTLEEIKSWLDGNNLELHYEEIIDDKEKDLPPKKRKRNRI